MITNIYAITAIATVGGLLFGFDIASLSAIIGTSQYKAYFNKSDPHAGPDSGTQGGITAAMAGGSFLGALASGYVADRIGRRRSLQIGCIIWLVGSILSCASQNVGMLVVGRLICGVCVGITSAQCPTLLSEIAPFSIRGRIVGMQQWAITWGIMIFFYVSFGCSYIKGVASFRLPWGLQMIPAIILGVLLFWVPESPRWLANHDQWDAAARTIAAIHANGDLENPIVLAELAELREAVRIDIEAKQIAWVTLFKRPMLSRTIIAMSCQMWSQLTGMNICMYYINYIFQMAGLTGNTNLVASSIQYAINVVMTLPALIFLGKVGRRPLFISGSILMTIWLAITGGVMGTYGEYWEDPDNSSVRWRVTGPPWKAVIASSYLFVASFAYSWGPGSWVYPPEIFPNRLRAKGMALATATNWAFNFALGYFVPPSFHNIQWKTYMIFVSFTAAMTIHVYFFFPETKKRSLEEMDIIFESGIAPWKTVNADSQIARDLQLAREGKIKEDFINGQVVVRRIDDDKHEVEHQDLA